MENHEPENENPEEPLVNEGLDSSDNESVDTDDTVNHSDDDDTESDDDDDSEYLYELYKDIAEIDVLVNSLQNESALSLHLDHLNDSEMRDARKTLFFLESLRKRLYYTGTLILLKTHNITANEIAFFKIFLGDSTTESETNDYPTFSDLYNKYGKYALRVEKEIADSTGSTVLLEKLMNLQKLFDLKISSNF